jgi:hypothetical protein
MKGKGRISRQVSKPQRGGHWGRVFTFYISPTPPTPHHPNVQYLDATPLPPLTRHPHHRALPTAASGRLAHRAETPVPSPAPGVDAPPRCGRPPPRGHPGPHDGTGSRPAHPPVGWRPEPQDPLPLRRSGPRPRHGSSPPGATDPVPEDARKAPRSETSRYRLRRAQSNDTRRWRLRDDRSRGLSRSQPSPGIPPRAGSWRGSIGTDPVHPASGDCRRRRPGLGAGRRSTTSGRPRPMYRGGRLPDAE